MGSSNDDKKSYRLQQFLLEQLTPHYSGPKKARISSTLSSLQSLLGLDHPTELLFWIGNKNDYISEREYAENIFANSLSELKLK